MNTSRKNTHQKGFEGRVPSIDQLHVRVHVYSINK